jgi:DNA-binding NarL/FixJ family response regulator
VTVDAPAADLRALSSRELEVLELMAEGQSNTAIAGTLVVSTKTLESHIGSIFVKLGVSWNKALDRRVAAVVMYLAHTR